MTLWHHISELVKVLQLFALIDINATVDKHRDMPDLLAVHGLTGWDTVASYFGIG